MQRLGIVWDGDLGVQSSFEYGGIFFVLTAPGEFTEGDGDHDLYIRDQLAADDPATLEDEGRSFAFVSGLARRGRRPA